MPISSCVQTVIPKTSAEIKMGYGLRALSTSFRNPRSAAARFSGARSSR